MNLMINADDFGLNERCTRAIARAFYEGLVTDTTMVANGEAFDAAVAIACEQGFSDRIGVHFNLTEGEPLTSAICSIPDFVADGRFHKQYGGRPLTDAEAEAVYLELTAQVQRIKGAGIVLTHADSHHYVHNFTSLAPIAARVCNENGISRIRLSRTFGTEKPVPQNILPNEQWRAWGFVTADHFGRVSDVTEFLPDNTEIMVHPDLDRGGLLIDRRGTADGYPVGDPLSDLIRGLPIADGMIENNR